MCEFYIEYIEWSLEVVGQVAGFQVIDSEVEVCAGEGNLSRALTNSGFKTKAFDVSWMVNIAVVSNKTDGSIT